jgi:AbrB family looped-hinge helix DNA binding protein
MMQTSKLSSKGQIVLPKAIREALDWRPGLELSIERGDDCVVIRRRRRLPVRTVEEVAGSLRYDGPPVSLEDMDRAIEAELRERWRRKSR